MICCYSQIWERKKEWLKTFSELTNGIPSVDTFESLFARLKPAELQRCFRGWMEAGYLSLYY